MSNAALNAKRAMEQGAKAAKEGKPLSANPFVTSKTVGLARYWEKGWREWQQAIQED